MLLGGVRVYLPQNRRNNPGNAETVQGGVRYGRAPGRQDHCPEKLPGRCVLLRHKERAGDPHLGDI